MPKRSKEDAVIAENYILVAVLAAGGLLAIGVGSWLTLRGIPRPTRAAEVAAAPGAAAPLQIVPAGLPIPPAVPQGVPALANPVGKPPALPEGWSYNPPTLGFRAAWPVPPGPDGFTPMRTAFGNQSELSNSWSYQAAGVTYHVDYTDFPAITAEEGLFIDRTLERIHTLAANRAAGRGKPAPAFKPWTPIRWLGHNARQIIGPGDGPTEQVEGRAIIFGNKLYMLEVGGPKALWTNPDARLATFFDTFSGL